MEETFEIVQDSLLDALKDSIYIIPFLLVTYLIMEVIEHKLSIKAQDKIKKARRTGPLFGALFGIIPQCGFSACASAFYAGRVISIGTLFAVYLSTSDEMLPVFIAGGLPVEQTAIFIGSKFAIGLIAGFVIDALLYKKNSVNKNFKIHDLCRRSGCHCCGNCSVCKEYPKKVYEAHDEKILAQEELTDSNYKKNNGHKSYNKDSNEHNNNCNANNNKYQHCCSTEDNHIHNHAGSSIVKSSIIHTLQTTAIILAVTLGLNLIIIAIGGNETLANLVEANKFVAVLLSSVVGAIPNCAASVVLAQLYVDGMLGLGASLAGLLMSAGLGYIILFQSNRPTSENIKIVLWMYAISAAIGIIVTIFLR